MKREAVLELLSNKVKFKRIELDDFEQGKFHCLFEIKGVTYKISNIKYKQEEKWVWDISESRVTHYTSNNNGVSGTVCPLCQYEYKKAVFEKDEVMCLHLNEEPMLTGVWGACLFSNAFSTAFEKLMVEFNPSGMKSYLYLKE